MALAEGLEVLKLASQHDAFERYEEASFMYSLAVDLLSEALEGISLIFTYLFLYISTELMFYHRRRK